VTNINSLQACDIESCVTDTSKDLLD